MDCARRVPEVIFRNGRHYRGERVVAEEVAVALSYGGSTEAVMMASPADLEDFAIGFSLSEGYIADAGDIVSIATEQVSGGIDLQIELGEERDLTLRQRRRAKAGPVGCGLCGVESIEAAMRPVRDVSPIQLELTPADIADAMKALSGHQVLNAETRAVHAAGFFVPGEGMAAVREDVGRHNALDKLIGHLARSRIPAGTGAIVMSSRISVELVQKAAQADIAAIMGISAPTALAIDVAAKAGMTLIALARDEDFEIFTGSGRIRLGEEFDAA